MKPPRFLDPRGKLITDSSTYATRSTVPITADRLRISLPGARNYGSKRSVGARRFPRKGTDRSVTRSSRARWQTPSDLLTVLV